MSDRPELESARYAYEGLERVIHEKARLGILTSLATNAEGLRFAELKRLCALTDGNLNRHLRALAEASLVVVDKVGEGRGSTTSVRLTETGRQRFIEYLDELQRVVADARPATQRLARQS